MWLNTHTWCFRAPPFILIGIAMSRTVTKSVKNIYHKSDEVHEIVDDKLFLNTRNNEQYKLMTFGKILVNGTVDQAVVTQNVKSNQVEVYSLQEFLTEFRSVSGFEHIWDTYSPKANARFNFHGSRVSFNHACRVLQWLMPCMETKLKDQVLAIYLNAGFNTGPNLLDALDQDIANVDGNYGYSEYVAAKRSMLDQTGGDIGLLLDYVITHGLVVPDKMVDLVPREFSNDLLVALLSLLRLINMCVVKEMGISIHCGDMVKWSLIKLVTDHVESTNPDVLLTSFERLVPNE